jgi:hypothetical protein
MTTAANQALHTRVYEYASTDPADTEHSALQLQRAILHLASTDSCTCELHRLLDD